MARPHLELEPDARGRDAPSRVCHNCGWRPDADHVRPPTSDDQLWELPSGLRQHSWDVSAPFLLHSVTAAKDTVLLALSRRTVTGPATGPGGHEAEQCQGLELDWEVQTHWRKQP